VRVPILQIQEALVQVQEVRVQDPLPSLIVRDSRHLTHDPYPVHVRIMSARRLLPPEHTLPFSRNVLLEEETKEDYIKDPQNNSKRYMKIVIEALDLLGRLPSAQSKVNIHTYRVKTHTQR